MAWITARTSNIVAVVNILEFIFKFFNSYCTWFKHLFFRFVSSLENYLTFCEMLRLEYLTINWYLFDRTHPLNWEILSTNRYPLHSNANITCFTFQPLHMSFLSQTEGSFYDYCLFLLPHLFVFISLESCAANELVWELPRLIAIRRLVPNFGFRFLFLIFFSSFYYIVFAQKLFCWMLGTVCMTTRPSTYSVMTFSNWS